MGINYYGKCTGKAGDKYDVRMNVSQNSQNIDSNTSNITVKVYVKRNDGCADSAYNTDEIANSVRLTVDGSQKVNKNIPIDTRNNVSVTLVEWTGDVHHDADGSAEVEISFEFTMDDVNLSGGSVSKLIRCTAISCTSDMTFLASSVEPDSTFAVTIISPSPKFTHRLTWSLGDENDSADIGAGVSEYGIYVPVHWIQQVKNSHKGILNITLKTYSNGSLIGTTNKYIPFVIPEKAEYCPDFDIALSRTDNSVHAAFNEYVRGISQLQVDLSNTDYKYGALFKSVSITVGDVCKRKVPSVFELTETGDVHICVSVEDSRGFVTCKNTVINVCDYKSPSVKIKSVQRCDGDGTINSAGKYLVIDYSVSYSSINGKNACETVLKFKTTKESEYVSQVALTKSPFVFGDGNIIPSSSYVVCVGVKDHVSEKYRDFSCFVTTADIPFNIRKGGKGAAFGKFAENDNELGVAWDLRVAGNLDVGGKLNYESLSCENTELSENIVYNIRYFPSLGFVWVALRFQAPEEISANETHTVARISERLPQFFTPLSSVANYLSGGQSSGGILNTGDVVLRSDTTIEKGTFVYMSGSYIIQ